jgi:hypothetical protein
MGSPSGAKAGAIFYSLIETYKVGHQMKRIELLNKLIEFEGSVEKIQQQLDQFGWDSVHDLVILRKEHLLKVLSYYVNEKLNSLEVEKWANAIESREDIGFEEDSIDLIKEIIYELANPQLTEDLTKDRANILKNKLLK